MNKLRKVLLKALLVVVVVWTVLQCVNWCLMDWEWKAGIIPFTFYVDVTNPSH